jgi:hypothetical protein
MQQVRLHWFSSLLTLDQVNEGKHLCSNAILAAMKENDLKSYFIFLIKELAYSQVYEFKTGYGCYNLNDWIHYPEESDDISDLILTYEIIRPVPSSGC